MHWIGSLLGRWTWLLVLACWGGAVQAAESASGPERVTLVEAPNRGVRRPFAQGAKEVLVAPGGKTSVVVDGSGVVRRVGTKVPLSRRELWPYRSRFAPDGSSLLLTWDEGLAVLRVPGFKTVLEEEKAADGVYQGQRLLFRRGALPASCDLRSGQVNVLGPALPGFDRPRQPDRAASRFLGVTRTGEWLIEDGTSLRAVEVQQGRVRTLFEIPGTRVRTVLPETGDHVCLVLSRGAGTELEQEVRCGPLEGPFATHCSVAGLVSAGVSFLGSNRILVSCPEQLPRLIDLDTGATTELQFPNAGNARLEGSSDGRHVLVHVQYEFPRTGWEGVALWVDLEARTYLVLREPEAWLDATDARRVFVRRLNKLRSDLFEVRFP